MSSQLNQYNFDYYFYADIKQISDLGVWGDLSDKKALFKDPTYSYPNIMKFLKSFMDEHTEVVFNSSQGNMKFGSNKFSSILPWFLRVTKRTANQTLIAVDTNQQELLNWLEQNVNQTDYGFIYDLYSQCGPIILVSNKETASAIKLKFCKQEDMQ